jgi:peptidyl-prolyl cis-trans isomerase SurA
VKWVFKLVLWAVIGSLAVSCSSKAKKAQQARESLERMEREQQALSLKGTETRPEGAAGRVPLQRADGIVARVNEDVILLSELEEASAEVFQRIRTQVPPDQAERHLQEARRMVLERLIEKKLLEQDAERRKVRVSDEELEAAIGQYLRQRGLSKDQLYVQLARERIPVERFKERIRRELMVHRMIEREIASHIHVSDQQCREYYETHRPDQAGSGTVRIQQIVLLTRGDRPRDRQEKRELMEEIRSRILKGEDFDKLARQYSQGPNPDKGGDCGYFKEGELLEDLDRVAFSLNVGEVSRVIETSVGLHLLRVTERATGSAKPFEEVKEEIRNRLMESAYQEELRKKLEALRQSAYIDVRL